MYPDQNQPGAPPPDSGNKYDFIVNPQQPKSRRSLLPSFGGGGLLSKLIPVVAVGAVLMIILWVVTIIFGGGGANIESAVGLTQTQQEIIRVSEQGKKDAFGQELRNASASTNATLTSQQLEWKVFLTEQGRKVENKEIKLKEDAGTDARLETATNSGTFDEVYGDVLLSLLRSYAAELEAAFGQTESRTQKQLLSTHFQQVTLLLAQLPGTPTNN